MGKVIFGTSLKVVNGIWSLGKNVYELAKQGMISEIDNEIAKRTKEILGAHVSTSSIEYQKIFKDERKKIKEEAKELSIKGGLLALGFSFFI